MERRHGRRFWVRQPHWLQSVKIALLVCPAIGGCLDFKANTVTEFTLHTDKATWPQARAVCASTGAVLLDLQDSYKTTLLKELILLPEWDAILGQANYALWIGFYDILPPTQLFTWTNSCQTLDLNTLQNTSAAIRCGLAYGSEVEFRVENCSQTNMFVCESYKDMYCNYTVIEDSYVLTHNPKTNPSGETNAEYCQSLCLPDPGCWATNIGIILDRCHLYVRADPSDLPADIKSWSGKKLYAKDCFQDSIEFHSNVTVVDSFPAECHDELNITTTTAGITLTTTLMSSTSDTMASGASATAREGTTISATTSVSTTQRSVTTAGSTTTSNTPSGTGPSGTPDATSQGVFTTLLGSVPSTLKLSTSESSTVKPSTYLSTQSELDCGDAAGSAGTVTCTTASSTEPSPRQKCMCPCQTNYVLSNLTDAEKDQVVKEILKSLTINKSTLSSTRRRLTSAVDKRPSARYVGSVGIVLIGLFGFIVLALDLDRAIAFVSLLRLRFKASRLKVNSSKQTLKAH